jgi:hypothetical protein
MRFVEVEQDGKKAYVNADQVILAAPSTLINTTTLILAGGTSFTCKGTVEELCSRLEGKDILSLTA